MTAKGAGDDTPHGQGEAALKASGLGWTLLQPTFFSQNFATYPLAHRRRCRCGLGRWRGTFLDDGLREAAAARSEREIEQARPMTRLAEGLGLSTTDLPFLLDGATTPASTDVLTKRRFAAPNRAPREGRRIAVVVVWHAGGGGPVVHDAATRTSRPALVAIVRLFT